MGGVSVSHLVLFIASLVVAAGVAGTLVTEVDRVTQSVSERSDGVSETIQTDLVMISDPGSDAIHNESAGENGTLTVLVKNTGSVDHVVDADKVDVLVDGRFITADALHIERADGTGERAWREDTVVAVEIDLDAAGVTVGGDTRVVVGVNGNEAVFEFRV